MLSYHMVVVVVHEKDVFRVAADIFFSFSCHSAYSFVANFVAFSFLLHLLLLSVFSSHLHDTFHLPHLEVVFLLVCCFLLLELHHRQIHLLILFLLLFFPLHLLSSLQLFLPLHHHL